MQQVKRTGDGTYLVYETPLGYGQTPASAGVAVWYYHRSQRWVCEECGDASVTTRELCSHVRLCVNHNVKQIRKVSAMPKDELIEKIWENARDKHDIYSSWDTLEVLVVQGLETWNDDDLIAEAESLGIDVSGYTGG